MVANSPTDYTYITYLPTIFIIYNNLLNTKILKEKEAE